MTKPKVTYALLCYNQEHYVRDAVRSALAQDLTPLDIILSDDCSSDRTFEILEEEAKAYRGPNAVRLNRNEINLGIEHNNKMVEMAEGDLIILAHGDDMSVPHRARRVAEIWKKTGASVLTSNAYIIGDGGEALGVLSKEKKSHRLPMEMLIALGWQKTMLGATLCFGREIYAEFGKLDKREVPVGMDHVFPFRGALLGGMYFIAEPLIYWRQHAMNAGDLVGDKSGLASVYLETYLGYRVMRGLGMLRDVSHLIRRRGQKPELMAITQKLQMRLSNVIDDWVRKRNALYLEGLRPTWIEKAELEKRPINYNYRVWPDIETSDIPEPPLARRTK